MSSADVASATRLAPRSSHHQRRDASLAILTRFAKERLNIRQIPSEERKLVRLVREYFTEFRDMNDGFSSLPCERLGPNGEPIDGWTYRPHIASRAEDVGKRFATLYHISPNAHSLLDLGSGTGYVVQCALQLGYDAAGAEIADPYVKMSRERLVSMGHDPGRIIKADFLAENFSEMDINGKRIKDFDIIHIYGLDKNIWRATRTIPQHMKQGSYFVIGGFNEPFFANDAEEFAAKHEIPVILEQEFCGATYCLRRA